MDRMLDASLYQAPRLALRPPSHDDAAEVFRFASDPQVTKFVGWPMHRALNDSEAFLSFLGMSGGNGRSDPC